MLLIKMLYITSYLIFVLLIPYAGLIILNYILLLGNQEPHQRLTIARERANEQLETIFRIFFPSHQRDIYTDFHNQLIHDVDSLSNYTNTNLYPNGIQRDGNDFYLWLSKTPDEKDLEDFKISLRQKVRAYDQNTDVLFNWIEQEPFLKLKMNLIATELLNQYENGQYKALYSEEGEI